MDLFGYTDGVHFKKDESFTGGSFRDLNKIAKVNENLPIHGFNDGVTNFRKIDGRSLVPFL